MTHQRPVRVWVAAGVFVLASMLTACSDDGNTGDADALATQSTPAPDGEGDGATQTADGGDSRPEVEVPTEPADIRPVAPERSAQRNGNVINVSGDRAAFVTPSGNLACTVTEETAVCQVEGKSFSPRSDHLVTNTIGACSADRADAMMLSSVRGAWTCPAQDIAPQADVDLGGWWASEVNSQTLDVSGVTAAVLPYGTSLTVGSVTCMAGENGISCNSNDLGKSFFLSTNTYNYG